MPTETALSPLELAARLYAAEEFLFRLSEHPAFADKSGAIAQLREGIVAAYDGLAETHGLSKNAFGLQAEAWLKEQGLDDIEDRGTGETTALLRAQVSELARDLHGDDTRWDAEKRQWVTL